MRFKLFCCVLAFAAVGYAKEPKAYRTGTLMQMDSVQCGVDQKDGGTFSGEILGSDSGHKRTHELLCQEYLLQADNVIYRIRPRDDKHPTLLPVGNRAEFRLQKAKMLLRLEGLDGKEREYVVVSMKPRTESSSADAASHINHLQ